MKRPSVAKRTIETTETSGRNRSTLRARWSLWFPLRLIAVVTVFMSAWMPTSVAAQPREGALVIPAGQVYAGNLATVTRDIRVEGVVAGDVTSWSGTIEVVGRVDGDVVSYSGQVMIQAGAHVGGHVLASGGALRLDAGATVAGQTIRGEGGGIALANLLDLFTPAVSGGAAAVARVLFGAVLGVFLLAFALLCIAFWPRRTAAASVTMRQAPGRALALGLLTTVLLALALPPLAALLAATLIGMPLLVLLLTLAQAPYIYGLATLARTLGVLAPQPPTPSPTKGAGEHDLPRAMAWDHGPGSEGLNRITLVVAAVLALLIALAAVLEPLWGLALFYVLASPGLGAVLLSRGGLLVPAAN